jgi:hypothetical protein
MPWLVGAERQRSGEHLTDRLTRFYRIHRFRQYPGRSAGACSLLPRRLQAITGGPKMVALFAFFAFFDRRKCRFARWHDGVGAERLPSGGFAER